MSSSPSASEMPDTDAVNVSFTRAVPAIVGAPVAAVFVAAGSSSGPATAADGLLLSGRGSLPRVHTAPAVPQSRPPGSVTATASSESGSTVISHRSWRPSTRRACVTLPAVTEKDSSRSVL